MASPSQALSQLAGIGMDANTGKPLSGIDHINQSIWIILTTRLGERCGRREFGGGVLGLVDRPGTAAWVLALKAAAVDALRIWEPRISIVQVTMTQNNGAYTVDVSYTIVGTSQLLSANGIPVSSALSTTTA